MISDFVLINPEITERKNDSFLETSTIITAIIFGCVILILITLIGVVIYLIIHSQETQENTVSMQDNWFSVALSVGRNIAYLISVLSHARTTYRDERRTSDVTRGIEISLEP